MAGYQKGVPDPKRLIEESVSDDYVVLTQRPSYASEAAWKNESERPRFIEVNALRFLRPYQKKAIVAIQRAVKRGSDRFLLEMPTSTGKTLTSNVIIWLFLRTGNATRVLFLVDRLELEDQALKAFKKTLANDYRSVIYTTTTCPPRPAPQLVRRLRTNHRNPPIRAMSKSKTSTFEVRGISVSGSLG